MAYPKLPSQPVSRWTRALLLAVLVLLAFFLLTLVIHSAFANNTPGIDFYVYWQAGRAFFFEGQDPYSAEVSARIQSGIYHGRSALPGEDPMKFNYPPFALLPVFPFLFLPFAWAQATWMAFNLLAVVVGLILSFPKTPVWMALMLPLYYQSVFGLVLGNLTILIFVILLWMAGQFTYPKKSSNVMQISLGLLLAWISIKPQLVWVFVLLFLVVSLQRRWLWVPLSFVLGLLLLSGSMFLLRADWFAGWLDHLGDFTQFHPAAPCREFFLSLLLPPGALPAASVIVQAVALIGIVAAVVLWLKEKLPWLALISVASLVVIVVHPVCISYDQLILLLPLVLWGVRQDARPVTRFSVWAAGLLLSYIFLILGAWLGKNWVVNQMPVVAYLIWLVWYTSKWLPHRWNAPRLKNDNL